MANQIKTHPLGDLSSLARAEKKAGIHFQIKDIPAMVQLFAKKDGEAELMKQLGIALGIGTDSKPSSTTQTRDFSAFAIAPRQWILLSEKAQPVAFAEKISKKIAGLGYISEQSASRIRIRISGSESTNLLSHLCGLDLHPKAAPKGFAAQTIMAQVGVLLHVVDNEPTYDLYVYAGFARSFWHSLTEIAAKFGYTVTSDEA